MRPLEATPPLHRVLSGLPLGVFYFGLSFFTVWTIWCHGVVFGRLGFRPWLPLGFAVSLLGAAGMATAFVRLGGDLGAPAVDPPELSSWRLDRKRKTALQASAVIFLAVLAVFYKLGLFEVLWAFCIGLSGLGLIYWQRLSATFRTDVSSDAATVSSVGAGIAFLVIAACLSLVYLFATIPDADDALFINLAVGAKQARAVYASDTMLGVLQAPFIKSTYKLESYQLLAAVVSAVFGVPTILAAHAILPVATLIWSASVFVVVHRWCFATRWLMPCLTHIALVLGLSGGLCTLGYHGFLRYFQGKGPFVTAMVPLIAYLSYRVCIRRSLKAELLLGLSLIASLGFTANAVYAGPLIAGLVVAAYVLLASPDERLRLLRSSVVVVYPALLVGYLLIYDRPGPSEFTSAGTAGGAFWQFCATRFAFVGLACLLYIGAGAALVHRRLRHASAYVLVTLVLVLNPFLWDFYGRAVTGNINVRLFWCIPIPLLVAGLLHLATLAAPQAKGRVLSAAAAVALSVILLLPSSILRTATWGWSPLKVPQEAFETATRVATIAHGEMVLAPEEISTWLTTLEDAPPVVEARSLYLPQRKHQLPEEELTRRGLAFEWVNGGQQLSPARLNETLERLQVGYLLLAADRATALGPPAQYFEVTKLGGYSLYGRRPANRSAAIGASRPPDP